MDFFHSLTFVYRNSNLYILIGIRLPSLLVSNLNSHIYVFLTAFCFNFAIRTDVMP